MLQRAILGGVNGVADLHLRDRDRVTREWRGTFVFHAEDEQTIAQLSTAESPTYFEGFIGAERRRVPVRVTSFTSTGLAFFEGSEAHSGPL